MAKPSDEIEDADLDKEENSDMEDQDESADDEESDDKDSDDSEEAGDESEDDDSDDSDDSDEDDDKPLTTRALKKILDARDSRRSKNRDAAARRTSDKGRDDKRANRPDPNAARLEAIEKEQARSRLLEAKRQFGYENGLSPDEVDVVFRLTKRPTAKALKDPVIAGALEGHRTAKRARNNIPSTQGRPGARHSAKADKDLTPKERQDRFADRRREILAGKQK